MRQTYDIILLDIELDGVKGAGFSMLRQLRASQGPNRQTKVLVCTAQSTLHTQSAARDSGAQGVIHKDDISINLLTQLFKDQRSRESIISRPNLSQHALHYPEKQKSVSEILKDLPERQRLTARLLSEGKCDEEIAIIMNLAGRDGVRANLKQIFRKLQIRSRADFFQILLVNQIVPGTF